MRFLRWVVVMVGSLFLVGCSRGISVEVHNASGQAITNVTLTFTGGSKALGPLLNNSTERAQMSVTGESGLCLHFTTPDGKTRDREANVYLEPGYRGKVWLIIQPDYDVITRSDLSLY